MNDLWEALLQDRAGAMLAISPILTIGVTIHILLRKREVPSAVGWIGLVWFAPVFGATIYLLFGVNRVKRRARLFRSRDGSSRGTPARPTRALVGDMAALGRGIGRITARPLVSGTTVETFRNGDEAYPSMLAAIAAAKRSIGLSSYIFRDDRSGAHFIDALGDANDRGVAVRVLIDGFGGGWLRSPAYHRLLGKGVTAARFMHSMLPWRMPFANLRNHRKLLVVDGIVGFTGGMNIADENVMATNPVAPVQDLHFRIEGPVVGQMSDAFAQDWALATNEELEDDAWSPSIAPRRGALARVIDSGPDEDVEKVEFAVLQAVSCAQVSIMVMTPYFLPDQRLITALSLAAMRGVAVDLVVPQASNHRLVDWASKSNSQPLLSDGVRMWLSPPPFQHGKIMVVDGEWCLIGSCNWDIRSFRLNFELCMEVYDRELAARLTSVMTEARSTELTLTDLDARSFLVHLRDAGARLMLPYL